jgi:phytoene dehydrogenase-like protein
MSETYDAVIVGGGHNGLTAAGYLAKAGLKTVVLERRPVVGGAVVTEEIYPGYRISTVSDIFHGRHDLDQIFSLRPHPRAAQYRTPVENLYLCGSGAHPGGGVSGAPGHNAARRVIADFKRQKKL